MLILKRVIFALISAPTRYIGNVSNLHPKSGGRPTPPPPPTPPNRATGRGEGRGGGVGQHTVYTFIHTYMIPTYLHRHNYNTHT